MKEYGPPAPFKLPETLEFDMQPYGLRILGNLEEYIYPYKCNGIWVTMRGVKGIVLKGTETSRLFHCTATQDITGRTEYITGISQQELDKEKVVRVAM